MSDLNYIKRLPYLDGDKLRELTRLVETATSLDTLRPVLCTLPAEPEEDAHILADTVLCRAIIMLAQRHGAAISAWAEGLIADYDAIRKTRSENGTHSETEGGTAR